MASPSRFVDIDSVEKFIEEQENENTKKKTVQNIYLLKQFLALKEETKPVENIPPLELNSFISEFIITEEEKTMKNTSQTHYELWFQVLNVM